MRGHINITSYLNPFRWHFRGYKHLCVAVRGHVGHKEISLLERIMRLALGVFELSLPLINGLVYGCDKIFFARFFTRKNQIINDIPYALRQQDGASMRETAVCSIKQVSPESMDELVEEIEEKTYLITNGTESHLVDLKGQTSWMKVGVLTCGLIGIVGGALYFFDSTPIQDQSATSQWKVSVFENKESWSLLEKSSSLLPLIEFLLQGSAITVHSVARAVVWTCNRRVILLTARNLSL